MRRLIFCWNYLEWGGAQIYFLGIMKLARKNWDVIVLLPRGSDKKLIGFLDAEGIRYEFLEIVALLGTATTFKDKLNRHFSHLRSWIEILRRLGPFDLQNSVLHIEVAPWHASWLLTVLSMRRANVFITLHNALPGVGALRGLIWRSKLALVSRLSGIHIFASNKDAKARLRGWVAERFWESIKVTYTTVNPDEIADAEKNSSDIHAIRDRFGLDPEKFTVLCVGQFIDRKGRWTYLDAASILARSPADIQFVWLTSSPVSDDDRVQVESYGLERSFHLLSAGSVGSTRRDILCFYRIADVFALPSFVEGLPIALLEAMAIGIPSISTNVYGIPEAVRHSETGLLIEPGDADHLAKAILCLRNDPELKAKLGQAGKAFVLEHFDERTASQIAIDAYEECFR
ncbi:MAG: glycosyltransferase family 4 protein [Pyrinomonadaceae bacterium]